MASTLVDLVKITSNSTGTGAITLGSSVAGYRGFEALTNGEVYSYSIQDGDAWEFGRGTFMSATGQFIRTPIDSSDGGAAINLRQNAQIAFVALSEDLDAVQLSNAAVAAAAQVAIDAAQVSADRVIVEAGSKAVVNGEAVYPNAYATTVPQGVINLSNDGIATGSGGTPGVYVGGVAGGPAGFSWEYSIGLDGKIASYEITSPGISTATTAPTLSYASGSIIGAVAPTATVAARIAQASSYWVISTDGATLDLYSNVAGTPSPVLDPTGDQVKVFVSAGAEKVVDAAEAWAQSPLPPDATDLTSKSAKTWALESAGHADDAVEAVSTRMPNLYSLSSKAPALSFVNEHNEYVGRFETDGSFDVILKSLEDIKGNGLSSIYSLSTRQSSGFVVLNERNQVVSYGGSSQADSILSALAGSRDDANVRLSTALTAYGSVKQLCVGDYNLVELRQRAQALVQGDNTQLVIAIIGDSIHDAGAYNSAKAWIEDMYDVLGDAGFGYTSFTLLQAGVLTSYRGNARRALVPLTITGTWTREYIATDAPDRCGLTSATAGDKITVAPTVAGAALSAARLFFTGTADGVIRYRWNGGTWTSLNVQGTVGALQTALLGSGMPTSGVWALEIEVVSGTVRLSGVDFQSAAKGVRFHNISCSNIRTEQFAAANATYWKAGMASLGAKVALIPLLTNDVAKSTVTPTTPAQLYGYAQTLCNRLREVDADIDLCWVAAWQNDYLTSELPAFATFYPVLERIMDEMHGAFINMQFAAGPDPSRYKVGTARAYMIDLFHPSIAGTRLYQDAYYRLSPSKVNGN